MQPVTDPDLLAILNGGAPAAGGPVYGPAPTPPKPPAQRAPEQVEGDLLRNQLLRRKLAEEPEGPGSGNPERAPQIRTILGNIANLRNMSDDMLAVGKLSGRVGDWWGVGSLLGQNRANVEGALQMVEGDLTQQQIAILAEMNNGNGVSGMANTAAEARRMAAAVANLDPDQDLEQFTTGLDRAEQYYLRALAREMGLNADDPAVLQQLRDEVLTPAPTQEAPAQPEQDEGLSGTVSDETPSPYDPGGPLNPQTPRGPLGGGSFLSNLGTATQSTLAGLAQGAAGVYDLPMQAAQGIQRGINYAVGEGGGALMDMVGANSAADWWRQGSQGVESDIASRPSLSGLIEQVSPTPPGHEAARFASQLVGGAMVPIGPKAAPRIAAPNTAAQPARSAAREVIDEGVRNNVRVMTSDVRPPRTFIGKAARATGERIPYAGTGGPRAKQQGERVEAVRELAREFGADASVDYLDQVADDLGKTRGGKLTALSRQKNTVIDSVQTPLAPANVARTLEAIDAQVQRLSGIDATEYAPVIDRLTRFGANIASGKNLRQVEENRKLLGAMFEDATLASLKSEGQKAINAIYAPLREDMADFIGANAGPAAKGQWSRANRELAGMAGELSDNVFRGVLRDAETTPENVAKLLFSKKPSEVGRLVSNLSPAGRAKAQSAVIARAIEQSGGLENISPDRFANTIGKLGQSAGVVFEGADLARLQGLERLLQATKQAGAASAAPPTGVQNAPAVGGFAAGSLFGNAALPVLASVGGLARLYESTVVRNMLVGLGKSPKGSKAESQLLERILKVATSQTQIRGGAANDVIAASPSRVAAGEQDDN